MYCTWSIYATVARTLTTQDRIWLTYKYSNALWSIIIKGQGFFWRVCQGYHAKALTPQLITLLFPFAPKYSTENWDYCWLIDDGVVAPWCPAYCSLGLCLFQLLESQKPEAPYIQAPYHELSSYWVLGTSSIGDIPKASNAKAFRSSNKHGFNA